MNLNERFQALADSLNRLPQHFGYDYEDVKARGLSGLMFWYREMFHAFGGFMVAGIATLLTSRWWAFGILMGLIIPKEILEARKDHQLPIKTIGDPLAWVLGFWAQQLLPTAGQKALGLVFVLSVAGMTFLHRKTGDDI